MTASAYGGGYPAQRIELVAQLSQSDEARVDLCRIVDGPGAGQLAAVKRLAAARVADPEALSQFRDEIWMAAAIDHPNVIRVIGWGEDAYGPFLATELVRGVSLERLMRTVLLTGEQFPERVVVHIGACLAGALAAAHGLRGPDGTALELVHRDLTPGNVLVGQDGEVKLTDFGLAKARQRLSATRIGVRRGDHGYMAPEQVMNLPVDARTDIFSLGVLLFEILAQRHPWRTSPDEPVLMRIVDTPPLDLGELCPKIDRSLSEVVHQCIRQEPSERWATASELGRRLEGWLLAHGWSDNAESTARFVRRNAMKQLRWMERVIADAAARSTAPDSGQVLEGPTVTMRAARAHEPTIVEPSSSGNAVDVSDFAVTIRPQTAPVDPTAVPTPAAAPVPAVPGYPEDASTVRRQPNVQLQVAAGRLAVDAVRLAEEARQAAEQAQIAAAQAETAAAHARHAAQRAQNASHAARAIHEGLIAAGRGDAATADALLQRAVDLAGEDL